jgi:hypothetical protein
MDGRQLKFNERIPLKAQLEDEKGTNKFTGPILDVVLAGPTLKPIRVYDRRHGDHCDPPKEHMGKPIQFADFIADIGMAALPYLRQMIDEAESFVP